MNNENFVNHVKRNTRFKDKGSSIDLVLTNRRYTSSTETGLSDHHDLILLIVKTTFEKEEFKVLIYRDNKNFKVNSFKSELLSTFYHNNGSFTSFENNSVNVLNKQAPKNQKLLAAIESHI